MHRRTEDRHRRDRVGGAERDACEHVRRTVARLATSLTSLEARHAAAATAALAWIALMALALPAQAQRTSSLGWVRLEGAEQCIATQELAQRVEQRVGHAVFVSAAQADLAIEGRVERAADADAFVATLVVSDRSGRELGRRVLRAPGGDCRALEPALVLVIAIGLDPDAALPATQQPAGLSSDTQALLSQLELPKTNEQALRDLAVPDPNAVRPEPTAVDLETPPERPQHAAGKPASQELPPLPAEPVNRATVTIGITGEVGVLPDTALGGTLRITLAIGAFWPLELSVTGLLPDRQALAASPGVAEIGLIAAGLALCTPSNAMRTLEFFACAGPRAGALDAHGDGFAQDRATTSPWFELAALGATRLRLGAARSWVLQLTVAAGAPMIRDAFRYEDEQGRMRDLFRAEPVVGRIELGTGVSF